MEDHQLHAPTWRNSFSAGDIMTAAGLLMAGGIAYGIMTTRIETLQQSYQTYQVDRDRTTSERRVQVEARFSAIDAKIAPLDAMLYRLGKQESETAGTNARVDRVSGAFQDQFDSVRKDLNSVGTKLEVLTGVINEQRHEQKQSMEFKPLR